MQYVRESIFFCLRHLHLHHFSKSKILIFIISLKKNIFTIFDICFAFQKKIPKKIINFFLDRTVSYNWCLFSHKRNLWVLHLIFLIDINTFSKKIFFPLYLLLNDMTIFRWSQCIDSIFQTFAFSILYMNYIKIIGEIAPSFLHWLVNDTKKR